MTKEELVKEADNWFRKYLLCYNCKRKCTCIQLNAYCEEQVLESYIAGSEPREKEIKSLGERCLQLQKDKGNLTDRVRELEQQIEKMKCCANCRHSRTEYEHCRTDKSEKWEIKENE